MVFQWGSRDPINTRQMAKVKIPFEDKRRFTGPLSVDFSGGIQIGQVALGDTQGGSKQLASQAACHISEGVKKRDPAAGSRGTIKFNKLSRDIRGHLKRSRTSWVSKGAHGPQPDLVVLVLD